MKATDAQIEMAYRELGSVWQVGKRFGMCGQSVHERLVKLGVSRKNQKINATDQAKIKNLYQNGFVCGDGKLNALCEELGRTKQLVCRYAKKMGLTNSARKLDKTYAQQCSHRSKEWLQNNPHPKGMENKTHTNSTKKLISEIGKKRFALMDEIQRAEHVMKGLKTKYKNNGTLASPRTNVTWKGGKRTIGGVEKYYRSAWEANYARYLQWLKEQKVILDWEHEPQVFWFEHIKRGSRSYTPDFKVTELDGTHIWHEVKGYYDSVSKTKIKRFRKYYPEEQLILIASKEYKSLAKKVAGMIKDWE